jgi:hypothetical protein
MTIVRVASLAVFFLGWIGLGELSLPSTASADGCFAQCNCTPGEVPPSPGATSGCIGAADNTVSVCGSAVSGPGPEGCLCVGGVCINNVNTVPAVGCSGPPC